jgi:uncharacterized membrane protein YeaQ/YmgE (transglycosylase-associated protein family)
MNILLFLIFGFVVGLIARAITPGRQGMSWVMTILLGVAGSFVGGFLASLITHHRVLDFHTSGLIGSVIGAVVLLVVGGVSRRS